MPKVHTLHAGRSPIFQPPLIFVNVVPNRSKYSRPSLPVVPVCPSVATRRHAGNISERDHIPKKIGQPDPLSASWFIAEASALCRVASSWNGHVERIHISKKKVFVLATSCLMYIEEQWDLSRIIKMANESESLASPISDKHSSIMKNVLTIRDVLMAIGSAVQPFAQWFVI